MLSAVDAPDILVLFQSCSFALFDFFFSCFIYGGKGFAEHACSFFKFSLPYFIVSTIVPGSFACI